MKYPHLFQPLKIGRTVFRNRIFASPTGFQNGDHLCLPNSDMLAYYELKAQGGAAAVTMGDCIVDGEFGRITPVQFPLYDENTRGGLGAFAKAVGRHGAVSSVELQHGGMCARLCGERNGYLVGPSDCLVPFRPGGNPQEKGDGSMIEVRAMSGEMIEATIEQYARAAAFAKSCGIGMVMLHGGHGWLLSQFMSPKTNRRTDCWGGSLENRMRLPLAIIEAIRRRCGNDFPIEFRMSGDECNPAGYDLDEGIAMAKMLDGKVDILHVSAGNHEIFDVFYITHPSMFLDEGCNVKYAAEIKKHVSCPVATVGALTDVELMEEIIASGQADIVNIGRQSLADPFLPRKARDGRQDEIGQCMRCYSCFSECDASRHFQCAINPVIGFEAEAKHEVAAKRRKRVLVAGGGIGGMEAALRCAEAGHEVTLCERSGSLGGTLLCEERVPFKKQLGKYIARQRLLVERSNIQLRLNTRVTAELAEGMKPDVIIAALGARPVKPGIPGIDSENVFGAEEMYLQPERAGERVVMLGGGLVGIELGLFLAMEGRRVTIVEMMPKLNYGHEVVHGGLLDIKLEEYGIEVKTGTRAVEIRPDGVEAECEGQCLFIPADTVVYAVGQKPEWELADRLRNIAPEFYQIGDCSRPRNIMSATHEAFFAARDINEI